VEKKFLTAKRGAQQDKSQAERFFILGEGSRRNLKSEVAGLSIEKNKGEHFVSQ